MKSLYQISREAQEIASQLEEGELTPELENALVITQNELQEKAINYGYVIKSIEDDVFAIQEEIKRLEALKSVKENAINRMKDSVKNAMQLFSIEKVTSPTLNLSLTKSESVEVDNIDQLSKDYKKKTVKTTISADKIKIKKAIKDGVSVQGARLLTNYNIQIK